MTASSDRILTTHVGKLPAPDDLVSEMIADPNGRPSEAAFSSRLKAAVDQAVQRQVSIGVDIPNDGELGKTSWNSYLAGRLGGYERQALPAGQSSLGRGGSEREQFGDFYREAEAVGYMMYYRDVVPMRDQNTHLVCNGPVSYIGKAALQEDIDNLKAALAARHLDQAFMPSTAPNAAAQRNLYYKSEQEYLFALADAMSVEYQAIIDAGLTLQIDMPSIGSGNLAVQEMRIEALNHALQGIPADRVRLHVCWGGWNGPHTNDPSLRDAIPLMFKANVGGYSIEAANPRHEHEWEVWKDVKLPDGKVLYPGFISQKTNVVEHPEVVAWRIKLYAGVVGRENVVASTDCGLGSRLHPQIAWAKLQSLVEGAALATKELWR